MDGLFRRFLTLPPPKGNFSSNVRWKALYKGFVPKVLRLGPGGGILLVVFDQVTKFFQKIT